jgi:hypothetical protein
VPVTRGFQAASRSCRPTAGGSAGDAGVPGGIAILPADAGRNASVSIPTPSLQGRTERTFHAQWAILDPMGAFIRGGQAFAFSKARRIIVW